MLFGTRAREEDATLDLGDEKVPLLCSVCVAVLLVVYVFRSFEAPQ